MTDLDRLTQRFRFCSCSVSHRVALSKTYKTACHDLLGLQTLVSLAVSCRSLSAVALHGLWRCRSIDRLSALEELYLLFRTPHASEDYVTPQTTRIELYKDSVHHFVFATNPLDEPFEDPIVSDRVANKLGLRIITKLIFVLRQLHSAEFIMISDKGWLLGNGFVVDHDAILQALPISLRWLRLEGIEFSASALGDLCARIPGLQGLEVKEFDTPDSNKLHLRSISQSLPDSLEVLSLEMPNSGASVSDDQFGLLFEKLHRLQELRLERCWRVAGESIAIGMKKWKLRALELSSCPLVDDSAFVQVASTAMKRLKLRRVPQISANAFLALVKHNSMIEEVELEGKIASVSARLPGFYCIELKG